MIKQIIKMYFQREMQMMFQISEDCCYMQRLHMICCAAWDKSTPIIAWLTQLKAQDRLLSTGNAKSTEKYILNN